MERRPLMQAAAIGIAVGLLATVLVACSGVPDGSSPPGTDGVPSRGGHLTYGLEAEPNGLDPTRNTFDRSGYMLAYALYDPLADFDRDGTVRPYLAQSFDHNQTFTEWRIRLRPGITFHSGARLDIDAVVGFVTALRDSPVTGPSTSYLDDLQKVDDLTAVVHLNQPWSTFPVILTGQAGFVTSPAQLHDPEGSIHPDGTGPFELRSWDRGQRRFELVRHDGYWRPGLPYLDALDFEVVPDGAERLARLRAGRLDVISSNHRDEIRAIDAAAGEERARPDGARLRVERDTGPADDNLVLFNTAQPPLDDVRVRQAVAYATDRAALARDNGWPAGDLLDGLFHRDSPWWAPTEPVRFDLDRARQLVRDYQRDQRGRGHDEPVTFTILGAYEIPALQQMVAQWSRAGIRVAIQQVDATRHITLAVAGLYDAMFVRHLGAVDPDTLWPLIAGDTWAPPGRISLNIGRLRDPQLDRAINGGRSTLNRARRKRSYADLQRRLAEMYACIFLFRSPWYIAANDRVNDARNVTLPDGRPAMPHEVGTHRLTETWLTR